MMNKAPIHHTYPSPTRESFWKQTRKVMSGQHARSLYINTTDPAYYEKLLRCNRHNLRALYHLGRTCEKQGDIQKAQNYYHRAIQVDPHFEAAVGALAILRRRQEAHRQKLALQALREMRRADRRQKGLSLLQTMKAVMVSYLVLLLFIFGVLLR
ncbi:tetratricopeptide repeat protein [Aneurinibacillus aneurinilyticus]|uniref:tetratricopeptide repeat protein n=1 Tax=Aneurinibacillus aneurinilyticus TaxID=1391 RepID=UPI0023F90BBF|nr:tetratricopeptide repeat protein [Aneurinibacillus aneurinilyticus]MCI1693980.1 tetratricopeptide repeat protein [Aneurinibacillus aneurinilyticus]